VLSVEGGEGSTVRVAGRRIQRFTEGMMIMTIRTAIAAVLVVGLAAFMFPSPVQAGGATREPISGTISPPTGGADGDVWITPGGILHEQGSTNVTEYTRDVTGTAQAEH
jgi:di/tricarboxylate transporter